MPDAILVDPTTMQPLVVVEAKAATTELDQAVKEVTEDYGRACIDAGFTPLAIAIAGASEDDFKVLVFKWNGTRWKSVTYDGNPISWIPSRQDVETLCAPSSPLELRPSIPPPEVLADRADEINRLLRESGIKDELRPAVLGAIMLALWNSKGNIRKDPRYILSDINESCATAFCKADKPDLSKSIRVDQANQDLAIKSRRIVEILERLNVTVLTAEHDYLGQLYESFFRYTGQNTIGQYFTPRHVTAFMADLCEIQPSDVVLDPACGTGGFLIAAMNKILERRKITRKQMVRIVKKQLIGFDREPVTAALCVANMILRGDGSTGVHQGDCFKSSKYPIGKASVVLMNPPFPHGKTDTPPEAFVKRALEGLKPHGKLGVILQTSTMAKDSKGPWRAKMLEKHAILAVVEMPDELFQPFASSTTSVVVMEKGVPHNPQRKTVFAHIRYDGLTLKKGVRVERSDGKNELDAALDAVLNKKTIPGFSGCVSISGKDTWAAGAYIPSAIPSVEMLRQNIDILIRRLTSFYARYAPEIVAQREAIENGELVVHPYRELVGEARIKKTAKLPSKVRTIGGTFDIFYGMKKLHSRDGIPEGRSLIISPTESYNGCYGWLEFADLIQPPFVTVAQTGSIGEAFIQLEPCAVNDDCLVLLPKTGKDIKLAHLIAAAAYLQLEKWRFNYGRKLTPQRIANFPMGVAPAMETWIDKRITAAGSVISAALDVYYDEIDLKVSRKRLDAIKRDPKKVIRGDALQKQLNDLLR